MWGDRRKKHHLTLRLDDYEYAMVQDIASSLGVDQSEALRRALWIYRILYDNDLKLKDALVPYPDPDEPLWKALKPIPELAHIVGIELKMYRKNIVKVDKPEGFK